jgi:hypothetical protein
VAREVEEAAYETGVARRALESGIHGKVGGREDKATVAL